MSRKIALELEDPRAIEIIDSIPEEQVTRLVEKYIVIGHMVLSHATISTTEEVAESLFAPLFSNIETLQRQIEMIIPTVSKARKKGDVAEQDVLRSFSAAFMEDRFEDVSKKGKFTDILASPRGGSERVLVEVKNYASEVPAKETKKFWRDLEARGARYGILVSMNTPFASVPTDIHMDVKADMTGFFVVNKNLGHSGHLLAYTIIKRTIEQEAAFRKLGDQDLAQVNSTLRSVKSDIKAIDDIGDSAEALRASSEKALRKIADQSRSLRERVHSRIDDLVLGLRGDR